MATPKMLAPAPPRISHVLNFASSLRLAVNDAHCTLERYHFCKTGPDNLGPPFTARAAAAQGDAVCDGERFIVNAGRDEHSISIRCGIDCALDVGELATGHSKRL